MPRQGGGKSRPGKRLIVACDGTWLNSDNGFENDSLLPHDSHKIPQIPSNVTRICRAIKAESSDGIPQVVYYQAGVGTGMGLRDRFIGGTTGAGLSEHIREAYDFVANNWAPGDEIFLLGFSRGAFTARSVADLVGAVGLLTKSGMADFYAIFEDYQNSWNSDYRPAYPNVPFRHKPNARDPAYLAELVQRRLTTPNIPIKAVGVWDTVGSLGIPRIGFLGLLGPARSTKEYCFDSTIVDPHIENAFQALALDEHREPFSPAVWELPRGSSTYLKQVWFPGVHSNIGGGYEDMELSNITLAWMISQLDPFIDFHRDFILRQDQMNRQYYIDTRQKSRPWSFGEILESMIGLYALAGSEVRTPGDYHEMDTVSGKPTRRPLKHTNEYIHASVRARMALDGPGIEDRGVYRPEALRGWKNSVAGGGSSGGQREVRWEYRSRRGGPVERVLPEDRMGEVEKILLNTSPVVADGVLGSGAKKQQHPIQPPQKQRLLER